MTTFVDFAPPPRQPFQFQPTLDGQVYKAQCRWNIHGKRWYVHLFTLSQQLVCCVPMIGSPDALPIASQVWDGARQIVTVTTAALHRLRLGSFVDLTVSGVTPAAFNGRFRLAVASPTTLTYSQPQYPGEAVIQGSIGKDIDLTKGYFEKSTLIFRASSQQFEVSP